jgi:hypothetical protein
VQRLGVGNDAIEIEEDRLQEAQGSRSPARMGSGRRASRGGYGQSKSGL